MSAGQIAAPSPRLRAPIVSALIGGAFAVGVVMGFGPLRSLGDGIAGPAARGATVQAAHSAARADVLKDDAYVAASRSDGLKDDAYAPANETDGLKDDVYTPASRSDRLKDDGYTPAR